MNKGKKIAHDQFNSLNTPFELMINWSWLDQDRLIVFMLFWNTIINKFYYIITAFDDIFIN